MARTGSLGSTGSLTPFGSGAVSFGAFDVANTKSTSAQETASLAWAQARAQYDAGAITDSQYEAAQQAYYSALDPTSAGYLTGQYQIAQTEYNINRDRISQQVQQGSLPPSALVDFDRQALAAVTPDSAEYRQRQDRLMTSEGMAFQYDEQAVADNLQHGRITNQQAQDWYRSQASSYSDNFSIQNDIKSKVGQLQDRIYGDLDTQLSKDWQDGKLTIGQVLSYVNLNAALDPTSQRARDLQDFATGAKGEAVQVSLSARYKLTREYADLAAFVAAGAKAPAGGKSVRTVMGADGKWQTVTSYSKPSASAQAAWAVAQQQVADAKTRMAQIKTEVGQVAGGWVTEDDMIRQLAAMQSKTVQGSKLWFDYQNAIDGYKQQKMKDAELKLTGVSIAYPPVASELAGGLTVGKSERPSGWTTAEAASVKKYTDKITVYQTEIDSGASPERAAVLNRAIATNEKYVAKLMAKSAPAGTGVPSRPAVVAAGAGVRGGSRTGPAVSTFSTPTVPTVTSPTAGAGAFFEQITNDRWKTLRTGTVHLTETSPAGIPIGYDTKSFEKFHAGFINAIRNGDGSFRDPVTGADYAIPLDAQRRVALLTAMDTRWVEAKKADYQTAVTAHGAGSQAATNAGIVYLKANDQKASNLWYILDAGSPGYVKGTKTTDVIGQPIIIPGHETQYDPGAPNKIGFAVELVTSTSEYIDARMAASEVAFKRGDYDVALREQQLANAAVQRAGPVVAKYLDAATKLIKAAGSPALPANATGTAINKDLTLLAGFSDEWGKHLAPGQSIAETLLGNPVKGTAGILRTYGSGTGTAAILDPKTGSTILRDGWVRVQKSDGTIGVEQLPVMTTKPDGTPVYGKAGYIDVEMKVGTKFQPVLAPYTVGRVGSIIDGAGVAHDVFGVIVSDPGSQAGYVTMSPFQPGVSIPGQARYTMPVGATIQTAPAGWSKYGIATGQPVFSWTKDGATFVLQMQPGVAQPTLLQRQNDGSLAPVPLVNANGDPDIGTGVLAGAGFGIDASSLNSAQRVAYVAHTDYGSVIKGAFVGATEGDYTDITSRFAPRYTGPGGSTVAGLNYGHGGSPGSRPLVGAGAGAPGGSAWTGQLQTNALGTVYIPQSLGGSARPVATGTEQSPGKARDDLFIPTPLPATALPGTGPRLTGAPGAPGGQTVNPLVTAAPRLTGAPGAPGGQTVTRTAPPPAAPFGSGRPADTSTAYKPAPLPVITKPPISKQNIAKYG